MPNSQLRIANFGRNRAGATGSLGVGYTVLNAAGATVLSRTTTGVYETAPGIYAAYVTFPDQFRGQILWDTGNVFPTASYAAEQYNVEENNPATSETLQLLTTLSGTIDQLYHAQYGRWKIANNQMLFYAADNVTLLATFNLFDDAGNPTMDAVFERVKVS